MIQTVGVVGAGTMGNGIAQVFAQAGFDVCLIDTAEPMLDRARETIARSLAKFVKRGTLTEDVVTTERMFTPGTTWTFGPLGVPLFQ